MLSCKDAYNWLNYRASPTLRKSLTAPCSLFPTTHIILTSIYLLLLCSETLYHCFQITVKNKQQKQQQKNYTLSRYSASTIEFSNFKCMARCILTNVCSHVVTVTIRKLHSSTIQRFFFMFPCSPEIVGSNTSLPLALCLKRSYSPPPLTHFLFSHRPIHPSWMKVVALRRKDCVFCYFPVSVAPV